MPEMGTFSPAAWAGSVIPKRPDDGLTSGRDRRGTPNSSHSGSDHSPSLRSNSRVRLALEGSVAKTRPPVSVQTSQASTVPKARSAEAPSTAPSRSSHSHFVAEK
jgi:hypothetical protein